MSDAYADAVQELIDRYADMIGDVAYGIARKEEGISMDGEEVTGFEGGPEELDGIISSYEGVIGEVAVTIARQALADTGVDLPERVKS